MTMGAKTPSPQKPIARRRRLVFALVPLACLLLLGELAVRVGRAPLHFGSFRDLRTGLMQRNYPAELHPTLGYVPRPDFQSRDNHWGTLVSIDHDGMRKNGVIPPPPADKVIAVVGDSFTFGDQVDDDASWPAQLEVATGQPVRNGGVFGYSLTQSVLRAELMLAQFPVSTLVVSFIPDDLTRCEYSKRYTPLPWFDLDGDGIVLRNVPLDHTARADSTKQWKDFLGYSALLDAVLANTCRAWWFENEKQVTVPHLVGMGGEIGKRLVQRIDACSRARGVRLLIVLLGDVSTEQAVAVLRHAEAHGVQTLDLVSRFQQVSAGDATLHARYFKGHMTRAGNGWAAHEIASVLRTPR